MQHSIDLALPRRARIVVVSDTHMPRMAKRLPPALCTALEEADLILRAGDFVDVEAVEALGLFAPVVGVAGNNDSAAIRARFPAQCVLDWQGVRIGLVHGHAGSGRSTPERALRAFSASRVDAVVFGHSHIPLAEHRDGVLLFNPGSPTDRRRQPHFSFGVLQLGSRLEARHVFYESKA